MQAIKIRKARLGIASVSGTGSSSASLVSGRGSPPSDLGPVRDFKLTHIRTHTAVPFLRSCSAIDAIVTDYFSYSLRVLYLYRVNNDCECCTVAHGTALKGFLKGSGGDRGRRPQQESLSHAKLDVLLNYTKEMLEKASWMRISNDWRQAKFRTGCRHGLIQDNVLISKHNH